MPKNKIKICGNPNIDYLYEKTSKFDRENILKKLGLEKNFSYILYTTQPLPIEQKIKAANAIFLAVSSLKDIKLIVSLHPRDTDNELYFNLAKNFNLNIKILSSDIHEQIFICDLVIFQDSTLGLDVLCLGKNILTFNFTGFEDRNNYAQDGVAIAVRDPSLMEKAIRHIMFDKGTKKRLNDKIKNYISSNAYEFDGKSTQRVYDVVENLLR